MWCKVEPKYYPLGLYLNAVVKNIHQSVLCPRSVFKARFHIHSKFMDKFNNLTRKRKTIKVLSEMPKLPECIDKDKVLQLFCETYGIKKSKFYQWYFGKPVKLGLISHVKVVLKDQNA